MPQINLGLTAVFAVELGINALGHWFRGFVRNRWNMVRAACERRRSSSVLAPSSAAAAAEPERKFRRAALAVRSHDAGSLPRCSRLLVRAGRCGPGLKNEMHVAVEPLRA